MKKEILKKLKKMYSGYLLFETFFPANNFMGVIMINNHQVRIREFGGNVLGFEIK